MSALREIIAKFGVEFDDGQLKRGQGAIESTIGALQGFAGALGAGLALGAVFHFISGLTEEADALAKQSAAMGLSLKEMQEWNYAAMMQGVSAETLQGVLSKLGSGKFDKGLNELGVSTKDASGQMRNSTDILEDVADSLKSIDNPAERNRKAVAVLGKSYTKLLPLLEDGADGIKKLRDEFEELGGGFDEDFAKQSDEFGDNLDRMKTLWKNLTITILSAVLPTLVTVSKKLFEVVKPLVSVLKHSEAIKAGMILLATKGVVVLSRAIGPLGAGFKTLAGHILKTVLPLLILEDFLVFLQGGDSLIGRSLEKIFGSGTSEKVRQWIGGVKKDFLLFIDDIKMRPEKLIEDWHVFTSQLGKDFDELFGGTIGGIIKAFVGFWLFNLDLLTGGWENFKNKTSALWDGILVGLQTVWLEIKTGFLTVVAEVEDAFVGMWNGILTGAQTTLGALRKVTAAIPGGGSLVKDIDSAIGSLESSKGAGDAVARVGAVHDAEAAQLATERNSVRAQLNADRPPDITMSAPITITVPPGTPADVANRVGRAAQQGVGDGLRATQAALVPGKG